MDLFRRLFNQLKMATKTFIAGRVDHWLSRRVPSNFQHTLSSRNIFIMPTRFGFAYLFLVTLLFLLGTNYQNNIILLFSYLLASFFVTVMLHSFYNLSQLTFTSPAKQFTFAKQLAHFPISIKTDKHHFDLNFQFAQQGSTSHKVKLEQCGSGETRVLLPCLVTSRGVYNLGRVKVSSEYSFGLFISWAMLDFSHQAVVFPEAKKLRSNHYYLSKIDDSQACDSAYGHTSAGIDDFSELKSYVIGESHAKVAWKQLARGQGKLSKHYQDQQGSLLWLKLSDMPSSDLEVKLSYLCFLILEYHKSEQNFGLLLDMNSSIGNNQAVKINPSSGYQHQQNCLIALAEHKHTVAR